MPVSTINRRTLWFYFWMAVLAAISVAGYVAFSAAKYRIGFPLDDAWIHQTYARNLALRGEWAFIPGKPSAGSTSPLWSVLLAPGYRLGLSTLPVDLFAGVGFIIGNWIGRMAGFPEPPAWETQAGDRGGDFPDLRMAHDLGGCFWDGDTALLPADLDRAWVPWWQAIRTGGCWDC